MTGQCFPANARSPACLAAAKYTLPRTQGAALPGMNGYTTYPLS